MRRKARKIRNYYIAGFLLLIALLVFALLHKSDEVYIDTSKNIISSVASDDESTTAEKTTAPKKSSQSKNSSQLESMIENSQLLYYDENKDFKYVMYEGFVAIELYLGDDVNVSVPKSIDGTPVKIIGEKAFIYQKKLNSVVLPEGIEIIGYRAFQGCRVLKSLNIPSTVVEIGGLAFQNCIMLSSLDLPESVQSVGDRTFGKCAKLEKVYIRNGNMSIYSTAFEECSKNVLTIYSVENSVVSKFCDSNDFVFDKI